jgi:Protein of unknown function (DUF4238)
MGQYKKQHYVQQSYLRRFSPNGKQIYVYDKVLGKEFLNGILDVAQESYFYRLPDNLKTEDSKPISVDDPLIVEKAFQKIEGRANQDIQTLVELPAGASIPAETRGNLSVFLAIQFLRTRAYRNLVVETAEKFMQAMARDLIKGNFGEEALKYTPKILFSDQAAGLFQSQQIFGFDKLDEFAEVLHNHIWILLINDTGKPLYTSDNPVVMHTPLKDQLPGVGIASPGIEIAFPLSSSRILTLADREVYGFHESSFDGKIRQLQADNVTYYNSLQVLDSERQIYCEQLDFALVEDMINKNPELGKEKRERVDIKIIERGSPS